MKKILLVFGANGELGSGVSSVLIEKDFDDIYLFDFSFTQNYNKNNLHKVIISDLADESNVINAFKNIVVDNKAKYYLFSTIGGFFGGKKIWETSTEELSKMINMNLITNFNIAKYFSKLIQNTFGGAIILTSAYTANHPEENKFAYGVSKSALSYLIKTLALEGKNIRLSAMGIAPYILDTKANRSWVKDSDYNDWIKTDEVGKLVYDMFINSVICSGNIIELKIRIV